MLRIGCLGAARITPAAMILPAQKLSGVSVSAVASRDHDRATAFAQQHDIEGIETDYEALIARNDVDVVYNALPPSRHEDLTIAALRAGKPVLCEKPFAMNRDAAKRMAETAEETGTLLMEAFHYRFHPAFAVVQDVLQREELGELQRVDAEFSVEIKEKPSELRHTYDLGGGALMDLGCYPIHWARTLLEGEPRITSAKSIIGQPNIDLQTEALMIFSGGVEARIRTNMQTGATFAARLKLEGSDATLTMENPLAPHFGYSIQIEGDGDPITVASGTVDTQTTYDYQLEHFVKCVRGDAEPLLSPWDAVANMAAIDAIYRAAGLPPRPG
ncbi:MAG: Gfo/Idh/MocA family oxidoreductase [Pseudomonadota bacterium]